MSRNYYVTASDNTSIFRDHINVGSKATYKFDFSAWADDNNDIVSVEWVIKAGSCEISNKYLSSNLASALISFSVGGGILIDISADTGVDKISVSLDIFVRDYGW